MIQSGNLTGYEARENSLPFPLLKRTDVLALGQQKGIFLSVAQTAQRLGTSPQIVISMIKLGLLETEPLSEANNWLITDKSIQHCLYKLAGLMEHPVVTRLKSTIDLAMAAKMLARVGLNEADLVRGILDGQVKSYCHQLYLQDLRQLVFTKSDIIAYVRKTKNREHCSMNDDQFG
jgi:hypothetical protein